MSPIKTLTNKKRILPGFSPKPARPNGQVRSPYNETSPSLTPYPDTPSPSLKAGLTIRAKQISKG